MSFLYELEGIYAQLQSMELDDEIFQDTLDSIDFQGDLEKNVEYFVKMLKNDIKKKRCVLKKKSTMLKPKKNVTKKLFVKQ